MIAQIGGKCKRENTRIRPLEPSRTTGKIKKAALRIPAPIEEHLSTGKGRRMVKILRPSFSAWQNVKYLPLLDGK